MNTCTYEVLVMVQEYVAKFLSTRLTISVVTELKA